MRSLKDRSETDLKRIEMISCDTCREYASRYLHAAQAARRKSGRRAVMYRPWMESAWLFRRAARNLPPYVEPMMRTRRYLLSHRRSKR